MIVFRITYVIMAIILMLYTVKRRLDLITVCSACFIVYSIYCMFGIGISGFYRPKLSQQLYYLIYCQIIIILLFSIITHHQEKRSLEKNPMLHEKTAIDDKPINKRLDYSFYVYTAIIVVFALVNIVQIGLTGFISGKSEVWEQSNILYLISLYGAYPSFAYGIHNKKKWIWIPSLFVELTIFFAGSRAFLTTMIIIFMCEYGSTLWKNRKSNIKIFVFGGLTIVFLLIYRMVDQSIMAGDLNGVVQTLSNPATWATALEFNEPRVIIANYDYVLTSGIRLPIGDIIYRLIDFIPGLTTLFSIKLKYPEYFSTWLEASVNGSAGVGGSIWGESYAMFGAFGVFVFTLIWLIFVKKCNKHLNYPKTYSYFIVSLGSYLAWYINRLDFNRVGQACKVMLFCFLLWAFIYLILGGTIYTYKYKIRLNKT